MNKKFFKKTLLLFEILFVLSIPLSVNTAMGMAFKDYFFNDEIFQIIFFSAYFLRIVFLFHFFKMILYRFYANVVKTKLPENTANKKLFITALIFFFIVGEIVFSFIPQNQGNVRSGLAQSVWHMYYNRPQNELGYRDEPLKERINLKKKKVLFLGDSFTFGHGINDVRNSFPAQVFERISKENFEVFNLGRGNSDTKDESLRLESFPVKPDILILQYFHNDIEPVGKKYGYYLPPEKNSLIKFLMGSALIISKSSYFLNFIAMNGSVKIINRHISNHYKAEIEKTYNDEKCLKEHLYDLQNIINFCSENKAKFYVLLIPDLTDISFTEEKCFSKIIPFLKEKNIPIISIEEELKKFETKELTVGKLDNHANEKVHEIIAEKIMENVEF